jgi:hypothetical protein
VLAQRGGGSRYSSTVQAAAGRCAGLHVSASLGRPRPLLRAPPADTPAPRAGCGLNTPMRTCQGRAGWWRGGGAAPQRWDTRRSSDLFEGKPRRPLAGRPPATGPAG